MSALRKQMAWGIVASLVGLVISSAVVSHSSASVPLQATCEKTWTDLPSLPAETLLVVPTLPSSRPEVPVPNPRIEAPDTVGHIRAALEVGWDVTRWALRMSFKVAEISLKASLGGIRESFKPPVTPAPPAPIVPANEATGDHPTAPTKAVAFNTGA